MLLQSTKARQFVTTPNYLQSRLRVASLGGNPTVVGCNYTFLYIELVISIVTQRERRPIINKSNHQKLFWRTLLLSGLHIRPKQNRNNLLRKLNPGSIMLTPIGLFLSPGVVSRVWCLFTKHINPY